MKAAIFRQHGGPEVLEYVDIPEPSIKPDEILVLVKACSINHLDIWIRQGIPSYRILLPHISGCDVAGIVERIGSEVTTVKRGDSVLLTPGLSCGKCRQCLSKQDNLCESYGIRGAAIDGGYAQFTTAAASQAIRLPSGISFEEAAAFPLVFLTAWHMLVSRAGLKDGETVLVHAAGSGVGHAAIQIAKLHNLTVLATVGSADKVQKAKALGADAVINYTEEDLKSRIKKLTDSRGVDIVFEHIGPQVWEDSLRVLAKNGRLVTCGATSGPSVPLDLRYVFSRQLSILGSIMGTRAELEYLISLLAGRKLKPIVDTVFPLAQARDAQERMLRREVFGKLVLVP